MSDSSSHTFAASQHHSASSSSTASSFSSLTVAVDSNTSQQQMQSAYNTQHVHSAPLAHSSTRADVMSTHPVNGTAASSFLVENEQPSIGQPAAADREAEFSKVRALHPSSAESGLPQSIATVGINSISSTVGATESSQIMKLVTDSDYMGAAHQNGLQNTLHSLDSVTPGHLTNSRPIVVAPIVPAGSSNPIFTDPEQNRPAGLAPSSSPAALPSGVHHVINARQEEKMSALDASLAECWSRPKVTAPPVLSLSLDAPSVDVDRCGFLHDTVCHCLMVDESLISDSFRAAYRSLMDKDAISQRTDLLITVRHWLGIASEQTYSADDRVAAARISLENQKQSLHIIFDSHSLLVDALERFPFLMRCGSDIVNQQSKWNRVQLCGPMKTQLPELIKMTFTPSHVMDHQKAESEVKKMLGDWKIVFTTVWISQHRPSFDPAFRRPGPPALTVNILPRLIRESALRNVIEKLHMVAEIGGGKCRLHAPNTPALVRCQQCESLGHSSATCSMYEGRAIRLLMKTPVAIVWAKKLAKEVQARTVYLGSDIHEILPSRRVTLLFDVNEEQHIATRLEPFITSLRDKGMLMKAPHSVSVKSRSTECRECGSVLKPHACPFVSNTDFRVGGSSVGSGRINGPDAAIAEVQKSDSMCRSWKTKKSCPRLDKQQTCKFEHPADHIPPGCFDFARHGTCGRGAACPYSHTTPSAAAPRPEAASSAAQHIPSQSIASVAARGEPKSSSRSTSKVASVEPQEEKEKHVEPAASPPKNSKRRDRTPAAPSPSEDAHMADGDDDQPTVVDDDEHGRIPKKKKVALNSIGIPTSTNPFSLGPSWGDIEEDDEERKQAKPSRTGSKASKSTTAAPASSLGTLSSPSKQRQPVAAPAAASSRR